MTGGCILPATPHPSRYLQKGAILLQNKNAIRITCRAQVKTWQAALFLDSESGPQVNC